MFKLRSARRQVFLAGLALLVLLSATAAVAIWRAHDDQERQVAVDQRHTVAVALDDARAQFFIGTTHLLTAAFADDPVPFIDSYRSTVSPVNDDLRRAREALVALNESDSVAVLDKTVLEIEQIRQAIESFLQVNLDGDKDARLGLVVENLPASWPYVQTLMGNLEQLANGERSKMEVEHVAANQSSQTTLWLLIGLSALALLTAFAILGIFIVSLLRPLASLQASVKAITSGDWNARAKVSGSEETACLALDFNEMTDTLVKRSEQLQESEGRFRNVLDVSHDLVYKIDLRTGTYDYASPSVLQLTGFTLEEFVAMGFEGVGERIHPEDGKRLIEEIKDLTKDWDEGPRSAVSEYRWKRKDGEYRWFSDNSVFIRYSNEQPATLTGVVRDITERKQADEALRESENRYRELFNGINSGVAVYEAVADGEDFRIRDFSQAAERIDNVKEEDILGRKVTEVFPGVREMGMLDVLRRVWRTGTPEHHPISMYRDDRTAGWRENYVYKLPSGEVVAIYEDVTEQRQAQEALQESEERFRTLASAAPIGIMLVDNEEGLIHCNERLLTIFGLPWEESRGFGWTKIIYPDDREAFLAARAEAVAEGREFKREFRIVTPQGEIRWVATHTTPFLSQKGESWNKRVGTVEDVTERKTAEEALVESEERFRTLAASAPIGIMLVGNEEGLIYCNERLLTIFGLPWEEARGFGWAKSIYPDDREAFLAERSTAIAEGREFKREVRIVTPQGEMSWVSIHTTPFSSQEGVSNKRVGTIEDVTERKTAEESLRQSERRFRSLSDAAPTGIILTDANSSIVYANRYLLTLAGVTSKAGLGHTWIKTIHPDDRETALAEASRAAAEQRELSQEFRILTKTKKECWVHLTATAIRSSGGNLTGYVGTIENITERRLAEEEKQRAYESIVMLLATAAEARDPYTERHLFRMRGFAEAIAAEMGLPTEEIAAIGSASLLHDLGKMRIPDSILTKPGPLTENEWRIMKQHPLWGEEMLSGYPWLETASHIARWHHEAWAGNGYPDGLRGEEIPLSAAIVAVADCLDALISDRPYKKAWPSQRAVKEIQSQSGKQYSPEVIDAFNRALHKGMIERITAIDFEDLPHLSRAA